MDMQSSLNKLAEEWGTVTKVEIKVIDPPSDIKKAMYKQKTAEQERRHQKSFRRNTKKIRCIIYDRKKIRALVTNCTNGHERKAFLSDEKLF